jgi:tRNA threonylcarbamoyladenosine biosynthesis protein TsaB
MRKNNPSFLLIETSSPVCSLAFSQGNTIIDIQENDDGLKHAAKAPLFAQQLIQKHGSPDAVVVSAGPGSYTGLRIGVSLAKGLCYGMDIPLIAIDTLQAMVNGLLLSESFDADALLIPLLDARRLEVYTATFDINRTRLSPSKPLIVDKTTFSEALYANKKIILFGSGAKKTYETLTPKENITLLSGKPLSATFLLNDALTKYKLNDFEDVAYFEPNYIKEFHFTPSKKNLLDLVKKKKR